MKKIALLGLMCAVIFVTTGCKKFSYNIEIDKKDNVKISETEAINLSAIESMVGKDKIDSKLAEAEERMKSEGYEVVVYEDGTYKGLTRTKNVGKLKEFSKLPKGFAPLQPAPIVVDKAFWKNKYTIKWQYDIQQALNDSDEQSDSNDSEQAIDLGTLNATHDESTTSKTINSDSETTIDEETESPLAETIKPIADLTLKLPFRATSHNANSIVKVKDGYEYKWDLASSDSFVNIELIYEKVDYAESISVITFILLIAGLFLYMQKIKEESF